MKWTALEQYSEALRRGDLRDVLFWGRLFQLLRWDSEFRVDWFAVAPTMAVVRR